MIRQRGILLTGRKIALYTILALSISLNAKHDVKQFELMPFIGFNSFDSDSSMDDTTIYGVRGTYNFDKLYGIRISYEVASDVRYNSKYTTLATTTKSNKTDLSRFLGEVVIDGEEEYDVVPYVFLGLGYESLSNESKYDVSQGLLDGGIGFRYQAWKNINLSLEGKILRKFDTQDFDYTLSLGLGYIFGKSYVYPSCGPNSKSCMTSRGMTMPPVPGQVTNIQPLQIPTNINELPLANNMQVINNQAITNNGQIINQIPTVVEQRVESNNQNRLITDVNMLPQAYAPISVIHQSDSYQQNVPSYGRYYVQMAVWYKQAKGYSLLNKIKSHNQSYKIIDTMRNNQSVKLVVVGPFQTKSEAKRNLRSLKSIKRDAFITTL